MATRNAASNAAPNGGLTIPTTSIVDVTPEQAKTWLVDYNIHNRNVRPKRVEAYARDMAAGRWQFNGEAIKFAGDNTLLDGQHRLAAVIEAETTITFLVVWGLPQQTQDTMDTGAARKAADALTLRGEGRPTFLAAIARKTLKFDAGIRSEGGLVVPTHAEIITYVEAHPGTHRAAEVAEKSRRANLPGAPSVIGTAYHICSRLNEEAAETFYVTQLIDAIGLHSMDPARVLLRRLHEEASKQRMDPDNVLRFAFLAWNHFRAGRTITKLQAPKGGWTAKNFPVPK